MNFKQVMVLVIALCGIVLTGLSAMIAYNATKPRLLFHNTWGISEKGGVIPQWHPCDLIFLEGDCMVIADFESNMLVVLSLPEDTKENQMYFTFGQTQATITIDDGPLIQISKATNSSITIATSGEIEKRPLTDGSAERLYNTCARMSREELLSAIDSVRCNK